MKTSGPGDFGFGSFFNYGLNIFNRFRAIRMMCPILDELCELLIYVGGLLRIGLFSLNYQMYVGGIVHRIFLLPLSCLQGLWWGPEFQIWIIWERSLSLPLSFHQLLEVCQFYWSFQRICLFPLLFSIFLFSILFISAFIIPFLLLALVLFCDYSCGYSLTSGRCIWNRHNLAASRILTFVPWPGEWLYGCRRGQVGAIRTTAST